MRHLILGAAFALLLPLSAQAQDAAAGEKAFTACKACHALGKNGVGPNLVGVVGRKAASYEGYSYSAALKDSGITWDEANLKEGIDCSRAIWFVFTRAGVPYTAGDKYIATAEMRNASSPMKENFQACPAGPNQIGDILVYRDDTKGDGHVVMVVDPERRIAWGSHGWDGNPDPVRGAGYQKIKVKKDWALWDRSTMKLVACWRHKAISQQLSTPAGRPGLMAGDMGTCSAQCRAPPR